MFLLLPFVRDQPTFWGVMFIISFRVAKADFLVSGSYEMCAVRKRHLGRALYESGRGDGVSHPLMASQFDFISQSSPIIPALPLLAHSYLYVNSMPHRYGMFPSARVRDTAISRPTTAYLAYYDPGVRTAQSSSHAFVYVFMNE